MKPISLSIPTPCHENWEAMTPEDKGRFCAACQKTVVDFTAMSDREVAQFFKKPAGSVCGRFDGSQLNRVVEVPRKRLPWIKYFFGIALPAMLFSKKVGAQGEVRFTGKVAVCQKPVRSDTVAAIVAPPQKLQTFRGIVTDNNGIPIGGASILFRQTQHGTITNEKGEFEIKQMKEMEKELIVSSVGFISQIVTVAEAKNITLILSQALMGEMIVIGVRKKKPSIIPLIVKKNTDSSFTKFSMYPNPVSTNGNLTIDPKTLEAGKYSLSIISSSGNVVQSGTINFEKGKTKQTVNLQSVLTGVYFVRLTNADNAKSFTEKIIVQ